MSRTRLAAAGRPQQHDRAGPGEQPVARRNVGCAEPERAQGGDAAVGRVERLADVALGHDAGALAGRVAAVAREALHLGRLRDALDAERVDKAGVDRERVGGECVGVGWHGQVAADGLDAAVADEDGRAFQHAPRRHDDAGVDERRGTRHSAQRRVGRDAAALGERWSGNQKGREQSEAHAGLAG